MKLELINRYMVYKVVIINLDIFFYKLLLIKINIPAKSFVFSNIFFETFLSLKMFKKENMSRINK